MKILLVAVGSAGDVHPFVGLGLVLRERGHDVTLITSGYFERLARQVGLDFAPFASDEEYRSMIQDPRVFSRLRGFAAITRLGILPSLAPIYQAVCQHYEPGRTVVVASTLGLGARIAQEKLGLPLVSVHLSPAILRSDYQSPILPALFMPDWLPRPLNRFQWWLADATIIRRVLER
ncbi:MAG: glycosyltransferase, partial [Pirellulales bacterium]